MTTQNFKDLYEEQLKELDILLRKIDSIGMKRLSKAEIQRFSNLFKTASHTLAISKTELNDPNITTYINSLVSRAHNYYYVNEKLKINDALKYCFVTFGIIVLSYKKYILLALTLFLLGFVFSSVIILDDYSKANYFFDKSITDNPVIIEDFADNSLFLLGNSTSSVIALINCAKALIFGVTFGIGTIYIVAKVGASYGAIWALAYSKGLSQSVLWSLITPRAVFEILAILICAAAGFAIGKSVLIPNQYSRKHALILSSKKAIELIPGIIILILLSGLNEVIILNLFSKEISRIFMSFVMILFFMVYLLVAKFLNKRFEIVKTLESK